MKAFVHSMFKYMLSLLAQNSHHHGMRRFHMMFGEWLVNVFNRVDPSRIREVGADIACSEWLLRNGGRVRYHKSEVVHGDYNRLPRHNSSTDIIEEIDATEASISAVGFEHLKGLTHVKKVTLRKCRYVNDTAIYLLVQHLSHTLQDLEIGSCGNITDTGLMRVVDLTQLKRLYVASLLAVEDPEGCESLLRQALPKCFIEFRV